MARIVSLALVTLVVGCGGGEPSPQAVAQHACKQAILAAAKNPSAAKVPLGKNIGGYLSWPHGHGLRLQNDFGAMIDSTASCFTDGRGKVTGLSINGETIF